MILPFKERFVDSIMSGVKIHTIREDKSDRWKRGKTIHFATGVRTKFYNQFWYGHCKSIQSILIYRKAEIIYIDNRPLRRSEKELLAKNDGLDNIEGFFKWFDKDFKGKIIHWTELQY